MYDRAKQEGFPFSLGYFYATIRAVNEIDAFRQRLIDGKPVEYDTIHIGTTVDRPDGSYGFSCIPYAKDFDTFLAGALVEIKRVRESTDLVSGHEGLDVVYCTVLRGLRFTSMSQIYTAGSSIPLLAYGESFMENGRKKLPHNVHVNHAFVDGAHMVNPHGDPKELEEIVAGEMSLQQVTRLIVNVSKETDVVGLGIAEHLPWDAMNLKKMLEQFPILK